MATAYLFHNPYPLDFHRDSAYSGMKELKYFYPLACAQYSAEKPRAASLTLQLLM